MAKYLDKTGLDIEDIYANNHSWSEMRREAGLLTLRAGPQETALLRAAGRLLHVDDEERISAYGSFLLSEEPPDPASLGERQRRLLRMLAGSLTTLGRSATLSEALQQLWDHPQVRAELIELLGILSGRVDHLHPELRIDPQIPLRAHARYTRNEILEAIALGAGAQPPSWREGVRWDPVSKTDLFAFTLDKSGGGFSPTTRYDDYAISPTLIHWESQSATSADSETGRRYINQAEGGTNVLLFARLRPDDRAFWCLGTAQYVSHEKERPIAFVWQLDHRLPADLFTVLAVAAA